MHVVDAEEDRLGSWAAKGHNESTGDRQLFCQTFLFWEIPEKKFLHSSIKVIKIVFKFIEEMK